MSGVIIYSSENCSYCERAKQLLDAKQISYQELRVDLDANLRREMVDKTGRRTVPQIFINDYHVGGCDDLYELERKGKLEELVQEVK